MAEGGVDQNIFQKMLLTRRRCRRNRLRQPEEGIVNINPAKHNQRESIYPGRWKEDTNIKVPPPRSSQRENDKSRRTQPERQPWSRVTNAREIIKMVREREPPHKQKAITWKLSEGNEGGGSPEQKEERRPTHNHNHRKKSKEK